MTPRFFFYLKVSCSEILFLEKKKMQCKPKVSARNKQNAKHYLNSQNCIKHQVVLNFNFTYFSEDTHDRKVDLKMLIWKDYRQNFTHMKC